MTEPIGKKTGDNALAKQAEGVMAGQVDWADKGGKCYECWVLDPCCSVYCCATWYCCGCLNGPKLFAWAQDQKCAVVNHCLVLWCLPTCCCFRYAVRTKLGVKAGGPADGLVGDFLCAWCCGPCTACQMIRGAHIQGGQDSWDFFGHVGEIGAIVEPFSSFRPLMK